MPAQLVSIGPGGHPIAVEHHQHGSGMPLLLLAGQGNSRRWWDRVAPGLAHHHPLVLMDYAGTGDSPAPAGYDWSTQQFAADAVAVMDALGITRFAVYGTSMGGRVAQWIAALHPHRVTALVLGCTMLGGPGALRPDPAVWRALAGADEQVLIDMMYSPRWQASHPGPYTVLGDTTSTAARRGHRRASDQHDITPVVGRIQAPTMVIHGRDDHLAPVANAELIGQAIATTEQILYLDDARHAYFDELLDVATPAVSMFLAAHP